MKFSTSILLAAGCATIGVEAHSDHGFLPPHLLEHIRNSSTSIRVQQAANRTLHHLAEILARRNQTANGQGITNNGDDTTFPGEEGIGGLMKESAEGTALFVADSQNANPGSGETPETRKRSRQTRQLTEAERYIYNNDRSCNYMPPVTLVRKPGSPVAADKYANQVWDYLGVIDKFYQTLFGRNSFDGHGGRLHGTVHYCPSYDNAVWDGTQMLIGDGDGETTNNFANFIDVIGHEVTHGVIQHSYPLRYQGATGALNEHLADVFGILVKQWSMSQTAKQSDWLMGAGLLIGGRAIRDFAHPGTAYNSVLLGKDPQPDNYADYYTGSYDNGGVHINSGIPNRAFYLASISIGGYAYEVPGQIWYSVMTSVEPKTDFTSFARLTIKKAGSLYNNTIANKVQQAWTTVGVPL